MSEEEKQAVKNFEDLLKKHFEETSVTSANFLDGVKGIHILNIIQKQQKEIERLKDEYLRKVWELQGFIQKAEVTDQECISKDKIKEKMRGEINKSWRNTEQRKCQLYAYEILKELLGE